MRRSIRRNSLFAGGHDFQGNSRHDSDQAEHGKHAEDQGEETEHDEQGRRRGFAEPAAAALETVANQESDEEITASAPAA